MIVGTEDLEEMLRYRGLHREDRLCENKSRPVTLQKYLAIPDT